MNRFEELGWEKVGQLTRSEIRQRANWDEDSIIADVQHLRAIDRIRKGRSKFWEKVKMRLGGTGEVVLSWDYKVYKVPEKEIENKLGGDL